MILSKYLENKNRSLILLRHIPLYAGHKDPVLCLKIGVIIGHKWKCMHKFQGNLLKLLHHAALLEGPPKKVYKLTDKRKHHPYQRAKKKYSPQDIPDMAQHFFYHHWRRGLLVANDGVAAKYLTKL